MDDLGVFTTGAFLRPLQTTDQSGQVVWVWVVAKFEDDSFRNGEIYNPVEQAENLKKLLANTTANQ